jgi:hypothetical protein
MDPAEGLLIAKVPECCPRNPPVRFFPVCECPVPKCSTIFAGVLDSRRLCALVVLGQPKISRMSDVTRTTHSFSPPSTWYFTVTSTLPKRFRFGERDAREQAPFFLVLKCFGTKRNRRKHRELFQGNCLWLGCVERRRIWCQPEERWRESSKMSSCVGIKRGHLQRDQRGRKTSKSGRSSRFDMCRLGVEPIVLPQDWRKG